MVDSFPFARRTETRCGIVDNYGSCSYRNLNGGSVIKRYLSANAQTRTRVDDQVEVAAGTRSCKLNDEHRPQPDQ